MRWYLPVAAVTAAAATLTGCAPAGGAPAGAATLGTRAAPGTQLWLQAGGGTSGPMAVSPRGGTVFVTGSSDRSAVTGVDYQTVAYSTATGRRLWVSRYSGPRRRPDGADSVAVSPDGRWVFVTGSSSGWGTGGDFVTVAYSAATGRQLWAGRYDGGPFGGGSAVAVSPGGTTVFVTGTSEGRTTGNDYVTIAYSAATGRQLWISRYNGPANGNDEARSMTVSPRGATVFVTGRSDGRTRGGDYATVAYSAAAGRQLWVSRYNGPAKGIDEARSVVVSPGGATVFVTGDSDGRTTDPFGAADYATVAYSAAAGRQLWVSRYNGPGRRLDGANSVAVSPGGATVFVTGYSNGRTGGPFGADYATVSYSAPTGRQLWVSRYNGPTNGNDVANSVAVSPGGTTVFVTGYSGRRGTNDYDFATVAYGAATGRQLWLSRYRPTASNGRACCVAVSPGGRRVFVSGWSLNRTTYHYATVAYRG